MPLGLAPESDTEVRLLLHVMIVDDYRLVFVDIRAEVCTMKLPMHRRPRRSSRIIQLVRTDIASLRHRR